MNTNAAVDHRQPVPLPQLHWKVKVAASTGDRLRLPPSPNRTPTAEEELWTEAKNERRCDLIDRKFAGKLSPAETVELAGLQALMLRYLQRVAPLPLEDARRLHQELLARAAGSRRP